MPRHQRLSTQPRSPVAEDDDDDGQIFADPSRQTPVSSVLLLVNKLTSTLQVSKSIRAKNRITEVRTCFDLRVSTYCLNFVFKVPKWNNEEHEQSVCSVFHHKYLLNYSSNPLRLTSQIQVLKAISWFSAVTMVLIPMKAGHKRRISCFHHQVFASYNSGPNRYL